MDPIAEWNASYLRTCAAAVRVEHREPGSYSDLCREVRELAERLADWVEVLDEWAATHAVVGNGRAK